MSAFKQRWAGLSISTSLWVCAVLSGVIYISFTVPFQLRDYYNIVPPLDYAKRTQHSGWGFAAYLIGILSLFGLYILGLRLLAMMKNHHNQIWFVFYSSLFFALVLIFSYPQTAIDIFVYALRSRAWAQYGMSPFLASPDWMPPTDPWVGLAGEWADAASPYGPVWEWLSLGLYHLSGGSFFRHLLSIKIVSASSYLGSIWLLYQILKSYKPDWALTGAALFAWNPLVLLESVQNAHNDIVMVFFLLVGVWAFTFLTQPLRRGQRLLFSGILVISFAASVLVKFVTLVVIPFFFLALSLREKTWFRRVLFLVIYGVSLLFLVVAVTAPSWPGWEDWAVLQSGKSAGRSLMALLILSLMKLVRTNQAFNITTGFIYFGLGGLYLWGLWQVLRMGLDDSQGILSPSARVTAPIQAGFMVFFVYTLLGVSTFHAWYLLWFIPLGAILIPKSKFVSGTILFSLMALIIIPYYETVRVWFPILLQNHLLGHLVGVLLMLIPVALSWIRPLDIFHAKQE